MQMICSRGPQPQAVDWYLLSISPGPSLSSPLLLYELIEAVLYGCSWRLLLSRAQEKEKPGIPSGRVHLDPSCSQELFIPTNTEPSVALLPTGWP